MPKKLTQSEVENLLKTYGCILLSEYINNNTILEIKCSCGEIFYKKLKVMNKSRKYMCNKCIQKILTQNQMTPYSEVKQKVKDIGYELLTTEGEYRGVNKKSRIKCNEGHVYEQILSDLFAGHMCKKCATRRVVDKQMLCIEDVMELLETKNLILLSKEYKGVAIPILVKCKKCDHIFSPTVHNLKRGTGCPNCYDMNRGKSNIIPYEERLNYVRSFNFDIITPKEKYINGGQDIIIECDEGHEYKTTMNEFYTGNRCPSCRKSKGEVSISRVLNDNNIKYIEQYRFNDCAFKRKLPFDFYLPEYNCCIEFDGKQHYILGGFGGDLWDFVDIKIRDTVKNEYCKNKNIKLIRIPYWNTENIEEILIKELEL